MNRLNNFLIIASLLTILMGGSCDPPEVKNGGCVDCEMTIVFDRTACPDAVEKYFYIAIGDGPTKQTWRDSHSNFKGGEKTFEIPCGKSMNVEYIIECHFENGEFAQYSDYKHIYPANINNDCNEEVWMRPETNY